MSPFQAAILGVVQGLTEFLPISSSAHLYAIPTLLHWPYGGVAFDVALHWGTLLALVAAYGNRWIELARDAFASDPARHGPARRMWLKLAVASIPAAAAGLLLEDAVNGLRDLRIQALGLAVFGFLLWFVDRIRPPGNDEREPSWGVCMGMGFAQVLALIPGVSRSGVTITAGRGLGLSRVSAAQFSFLLATPITFGAGVLELRHLPHDLPLGTLAIGVACAAVTGFLAIRGLIAWLSRAGFGVFFAYRLAFAAVLLLAARG